ncbi:TPA: recombinase family protein [Streptococcus pyogenes serotype M1]|nr:recombinase family protein [Streptococcus pyogenes serotype M1]HER0104824.1 recombinase family protein [Streptococcus pyogenes]HEQ9854844.1 recombinase family protein [Streptococcus pyogenes serotype M1]HEQ9859307.1 recombinase family protein [Streptococcus pyogenes serotype M1]HEQ9860498.1 recombinase family protein [Streptococcus pyogenes serotype M1]
MSKRISDTYRVAMYLRLSQDDEKYDKDFKAESNSISNQRLQIQDYIDKNEDMELAKEYVDDGYSGINFERPAFKEMMEDVITGSINCIVVKDLSRFGRDYIDSGRYLQRVFPSLDIRFIALNDNYDSFTASETEKNLVIPFKNFINDNYCRDTSAKVRSVCKVKRKQGQFISNYAPYGYEKDKEDKHKIVIDKEVEYVVRKIFSMKLEGYSSYSIAKHLNDNGIPSPMEHKKAKGIRYKTGFSTKAVAKWDTPAVNRILINEIYIGTLQQGKREKINYKLDKVVSKNKSDWIEIEDNHEAIIDPYDFEIVQKLLKCDIKAKTVGEKADLFSGLLFCKDCNAQMTKKVDKRGKTPTVYYICSSYNKGHNCSRHSIKQEELQRTVLEMIRHYIQYLGEYESVSEKIKEMEVSYELFQKIDKRQEYTKKNKAKFELLKSSLYQDLKEGIIAEEEFYDMREFYTNRIVESELILEKQSKEIARLYKKSLGNQNFLADIKKYQNIGTLERGLLVRLVDKIYVLEDKKIEIQFNYDETIEILDKLSSYTAQTPEIREVV